MELYGYGGGFEKATGEISPANWKSLEYITTRVPRSLDDHVRSAISVYGHLIDHYEAGSLLFVEGGEEPLPIPLLDGSELPPEERKILSVFTSLEANEVLARMGMQPTPVETRVLDNVLNCYSTVVQAALNKESVVARGPDEGEFHIIMLDYSVEEFDILGDLIN